MADDDFVRCAKGITMEVARFFSPQKHQGTNFSPKCIFKKPGKL
jgi:hypothetical protein